MGADDRIPYVRPGGEDIVDSSPQIEARSRTIRPRPVGRGAARLAMVITVVVAMLALAIAPAKPAAASSPVATWGDVSLARNGTGIFSVGGPGYAKGVFDEWAAFKTTVQSAIREMITPVAQEAFRQYDHKVTVVEVTILDEPLELSFTADGNGNVTANATLPTARIWIKAERHDAGIKTSTVKTTLHIGPVKLAVNYNVFTGVRTASFQDVPVQTDVKVRTGIVGKVLSFLINTVIGNIVSAIFPPLGGVMRATLQAALRVVGGVMTFTGGPNVFDAIVEIAATGMI